MPLGRNIGWPCGWGLGTPIVGATPNSVVPEPLPTASSDNAIFFGQAGVTRFDKVTGVDIPAGDWSLGMFLKFPSATNASNSVLCATASATNPFSNNDTFNIHYRKADGRLTVWGYDGAGNTLGQYTPPLPAANVNSNALVTKYPIPLDRSFLLVVVKTGSWAQMWIKFDGHAPVKAAECFTSMGAITTNDMRVGNSRDSSHPGVFHARNLFKLSYALTKDQIDQIGNGVAATTFGTPVADDYLYLLDANTATLTDTINSITMSRTFNNATIVTGVGLAAQTDAVFLDPVGTDGFVVQQVGGVATINLSGTYRGADGGDIEVQLIDFNGNGVRGWETVDTAISGNTWSGSISGVPKGKRHLKMQMRKVGSSDVMTTSLRMGVGENVMLCGQSLQQHMGYPVGVTTYQATASPQYGSSNVTPNGYVSAERDVPMKVTLVNAKQVTVTGAANNGSGLIRITCSGGHGAATGERVSIQGIVGTTEANGFWTVTVVSRTEIDLQGSTFANAYSSGGVLYPYRASALVYDSTLEGTPDGHVIIGNAISEAYGCVVCITNQSVGGQAINRFNTLTNNGGSNDFTNTALLAAEGMGGIGTYLWFHGHANIGETSYFMDSGTWDAPVGFGALGTLYDLLTTYYPNVRFGVAGFTAIGGTTAVTPANLQGFRFASKSWCDRKITAGAANVFFTGWYGDLEVQWENGTSQNAHLTPIEKGYPSMAARQGHAVARKLANSTAQIVGPTIASAARSGATIDLTIAHNGGTDIEWARMNDGAIPSGFEVSTATNFGSLLTISDIDRINATTLRITLSADPGATCYVRYQYGRPGATAANTYGTARITGVADNGAGLIRITCATSLTPATPTSSQKNNTGHGVLDNQWISVVGVKGATQANGAWQADYVSDTAFDLVGSSSVGLGTFVAGENLWQTSATGIVSNECGIPIYDDRTVGGYDTLGLPLEPTETYVTTT